MRPAIANDFQVLGVLVLGDQLTLAELAERTALTTRQTRDSVLRLQSRGLVAAPGQRARWEITARGRGLWFIQGRRFTW